jgi:hypothetical protein
MPMPFLFVNGKPAGAAPRPLFTYAILEMDHEYLKAELLPSLAERHFSRGGASLDLHVAVVRTSTEGGLIYTSERSFAPSAADGADASADLFQVRTQDFATMAAEVRRFATFTTVHAAPLGRGSGFRHPSRLAAAVDRRAAGRRRVCRRSAGVDDDGDRASDDDHRARLEADAQAPRRLARSGGRQRAPPQSDR